MLKKEIDYILKYANKITEKITVYFMVNVSNFTKADDYTNTEDSIITEFFTLDEYDMLITAIKECKFKLKVFYNNNEFIKYALNNLEELQNTNSVVFNLSRSGKGLNKKALIPAFCESNNILYTGPNAYSTCLGRHKYHSNLLLESNNTNSINSWLFMKHGWLGSNEPPQNTKIIAKPAFESASRGIKNDNIMFYDSQALSYIQNLSKEFEQDIIVQEFISGIEVEVPILNIEKPYALNPVGIKLADSSMDGIITYKDAFDENYSFYSLQNSSLFLSNKLKEIAEKAVNILNLGLYSRVDFRVDCNETPYIIDISTHPYILKHSSFSYAFLEYGYTYNDLIKLIVLDPIIKKHSLIKS